MRIDSLWLSAIAPTSTSSATPLASRTPLAPLAPLNLLVQLPAALSGFDKLYSAPQFQNLIGRDD